MQAPKPAIDPAQARFYRALAKIAARKAAEAAAQRPQMKKTA